MLTIEEFLPKVRDTRFIFVYRNPDQVADSLLRRDSTGADGKSPDRGTIRPRTDGHRRPTS